MFSLAPSSSLSYTASVQTNYINGFGKSLETIHRGAPDVGGNISYDVIQPVDDRQAYTTVSYLPYATTYGNRFLASPFSSQQTYYQAKTPNEHNATYAKNIISYSASNVPTSQTYAPGSSFVGQGNGTTKTATSNTGAENIVIYAYVSGVLTNEGNYSAGTLAITTSTDSHGSTTKTYVDKSGRLICKQVYTGANNTTKWLTSYYVYDDLGRLIYIMPPKEVADGATTTLSTLGYTYQYDHYGNPISANTPGKTGSDIAIYDSRHRKVLIQSPLMKSLNQYFFTIYDGRDRVVMAGIYTSVRTNSSLQAILNNPSGYTYASTSLLNYLVNGVTPNNYPSSIDSCEIDMLKYYDQYPTTFLTGSFIPYTADYLQGSNMVNPIPYPFAQGMLTASQVRVKDPSNSNLWISRKFFYDQKGHNIQIQTLNPWNHTTPDVITMQYDFVGQMVQEINVHNDTSTSHKLQTTVATVYNYDMYHDGRLTSVQQRIDTFAWRYLSTYQYDSLGRVKQKQLGGVEEQDYTYNIRGQLSGINTDYAQTAAESSLTKTFGEIIDYDYGFNTPRYDGNIAGIIWRGGGSGAQLRSYAYTYDTAKRMIAANFYQAPGGSNTWQNTVADYTTDGLKYDEGGNITAMHQKGMSGSSIVDIDQLAYNYNINSNQLSILLERSQKNYFSVFIL